MPRKLLDDIRSGTVMRWSVTRGKCSFGDNHESVRKVDGQWWGESSHSFDCSANPKKDVCPACHTTGQVEIPLAERVYDGTEGGETHRPCKLCNASGFVPGPHWPWRHDYPGPVKRSLR